MGVWLSLLVGFLLVAGQVCFKLSTQNILGKGSVTIDKALHVAISPLFLLGGLIYVVATAGYLLLLSRYDYTIVQVLVIGGSIVLTFVAGATIFHEKIQLLNLVGLVLFLLGIALIVRR